MYRFRFVALLSVVASASWTAAGELEFAGLRLNQAQVIGTHNSYHVTPHASLEALIRATSDATFESIEYTHRPLTEQFERLGIRQIELDLFPDSEGGRFAKPLGVGLAKAGGLPPVPNFDPQGHLWEPGIKILHFPDFDYLTTVHTFRQALEAIEAWSDANPEHFPLTILLELKSSGGRPGFTSSEPFDEERLREIDAEILSVLDRDDLIAPSDVRGDYPSLPQAIAERGWPSIASSRGRVLFCMDNGGALRDRYLAMDPEQDESLLFLSMDTPSHPAAGFFKLNNAFSDFETIQERVRQGFIVRTRTDTPTQEARDNNTERRDRAMACGAQFLSTDYPEPNPSFGPYTVAFPQGEVARVNPVSGPEGLSGVDLEREVLAVDSQTPVGWTNLETRARAAHADRRLAEASLYYRAILDADPAAPLSAADRAMVVALAPELLTVPGEPFGLRDAVAIVHPEEPWIAYHLFWEDDIDYPEDNDPVDHEVFWVRFDPETREPTDLKAYFHGRLMPQVRPGRRLERPYQVGVEWGKHGSVVLPHGSDGPTQAGLQENWARLAESGIRKPDHPLARAWPKRFEGSLRDYQQFREKRFDLAETLAEKGMCIRSRWGNAVLDQHFLPYNFSAKPDWPWQMGE